MRRSELWFVLLMVVALPCAAQKTLYFTPTAIGANIWALSEAAPTGAADSTSAVSNAANTTGWYHVDPGLSDSTADAAEPAHAPMHNSLWVTNASYSGEFGSGNWTFTLRKSDTKSNRVGKAHVNLYRSSSQTDQSGATLLADCTDGADDWTGAAATITVTCSTAAITIVSNEYLVVHLLNQVTTGGTGTGSWTLVVSDSVNGLSRFTTPAFTSAAGRRRVIIAQGQ